MKRVTNNATGRPSVLRAIVVAVSGAVLMGSALTARADITAFSPSAYAESELFVNNFRIIDTSTGVAPTTGPAGIITSLVATVSSSTSATINGSGPAPGGATIDPLAAGNPTIALSSAAGPNAANYVPYTSYTTASNSMGAGTFSGAASNHQGNALALNGAGTTQATTQAQVNINGSSASGVSDSRQLLGTTFTLTVAATRTFNVLFDAETYMRIALGQPQVQAGALRAWGIQVRPQGSLTNLLDWSPQGTGTDLSGACFPVACSVLFDPFDLNFTANLQALGDLDQTNARAAFGVQVTLAPGIYVIALQHETGANAQAALVPEPGSLALLGVALMALTGMRRRKSKQA